MKMYRIIAAFVAVIIMSVCVACGDKSEVIQPPEVLIPQTTATHPVQTTTEYSSSLQVIDEPAVEESEEQTTTVTQTATDIPQESEEPQLVTEEPETEEPLDPLDYGTHTLTDEQLEFTERSIFIGDSICKGFGTYNVLSFAHVYANGSMGTRNFDEYTFTYGKKNEEISYTELLERTQPDLIFLSMGMNDINMIHPSDYSSNYAAIIDTALTHSDAVVYLCAMTPVRSNFTSNERIDYFNNALQELVASYPERVYYVDYGRHMLNDNGLLNNQLDGGDGVHLSPYAYRIALWEIYHTLVEDGTLYPAAVAPTVEAVETEESTETETDDLISESTASEFTSETPDTAEEAGGGIRVE